MSPRLVAITGFRLTTNQPYRLARFYAEGIGFAIVGRTPIPAEEMTLLGLAGGGIRLALRLGGQTLDLDCFDRPGEPYPAGTTAADGIFQHLAVVASDAAAAHTRACAHGATAISTDGPVTLPAAAGGVTAVKLRDPEGHPLEFLQFPTGANPRWHGEGMLGIDHSAISVADTRASRRFYESLGLMVRRPTFNHGPTQAALDGLPEVQVDVVPLMPTQDTPHLELLGYLTPVGRRAARRAVSDVAATRIVWQADRNALLYDPDGHLHLLRR